jgi:OmpA-OmpF porin, OOP family
MTLRATLALNLTVMTAVLAGCGHIPRDVPPTADTPAGKQTAGLLERFGTDQAALTALAAKPGLKNNFDFARAQCFVQHAYSEQHENDRSGFSQAALDQAEGITKALQSNTSAPATALINHPQRMRNDLWALADRYKGDRCAQATAGCLEVQLVRAGHEYHTTGWRHANSYFAIAEDMAQQAQAEAAACAPPAPPAPVVPSLPASPPPPPVLPKLQQQTINLGADVLFKFDKASSGDVLVEGLRQLDDAASKLKAVDLVNVKVIGYTDPEGSESYNQALSQRRADTVKSLLVQRGVDASKIATEGRGERDVIVNCDAKKLRGKGLNACNQPNRRVLIEFSYQSR